MKGKLIHLKDIRPANGDRGASERFYGTATHSVVALLSSLSLSCGTWKNNLPPVAASTATTEMPETSIEAYEPVPIRNSVEVAPAVAAALLPVGEFALKELNKAAWSAMDKYADGYGASYSAISIASNFGNSNQAPAAYPFVFKRTVSFNSKSEADKVLIKGYKPISDPKATPYRAVVMEVPFVLLTTGGEHLSWRFIAVDDPSLKGVALGDSFPSETSYYARKGKALGIGNFDKFEVGISVACRVSQTTSTGGVLQFASDPATAALKGAKLQNVRQPVPIASDWLPAPQGKAYSVKCTVVESSKMKDWIKKAAENARTKGDSYIEKQFVSE
jgi:hypothetical protein